MATPRFDDDIGDLLTPSSLWDRVIGADEQKRSTKTQLPDKNLVAACSVLRSHYDRLCKYQASLHNQYYKRQIDQGLMDEIQPGDVPEYYPGIAAFGELHQNIVEHFASYQGFSLKTLAGLMRLEQEAEHRRRDPGSADDAAHQQPPAKKDGGKWR